MLMLRLGTYLTSVWYIGRYEMQILQIFLHLLWYIPVSTYNDNAGSEQQTFQVISISHLYFIQFNNRGTRGFYMPVRCRACRHRNLRSQVRLPLCCLFRCFLLQTLTRCVFIIQVESSGFHWSFYYFFYLVLFYIIILKTNSSFLLKIKSQCSYYLLLIKKLIILLRYCMMGSKLDHMPKWIGKTVDFFKLIAIFISLIKHCWRGN